MHDVRYDNVTLIPLVLQLGAKSDWGVTLSYLTSFSSKIIPSSLGVGSY
jgi:hypothetical protein